MFVWWALSAAHAAEIVFLLSTPVQVQVDGVHIETLTSSNATAKDLSAGTHTIRVIDMLSKPILTQEITLAADEQVVMRYKSKVLTEQSRGKIDGAEDKPSAPSAMAGADFSVLLEHVKGASSDAARLDLIRFVVALHALSVDQTASLMNAFGTDANKIAVVEIARPKITDPDRSFVLASQVSEASRPKIQALFP